MPSTGRLQHHGRTRHFLNATLMALMTSPAPQLMGAINPSNHFPPSFPDKSSVLVPANGTSPTEEGDIFFSLFFFSLTFSHFSDFFLFLSPSFSIICSNCFPPLCTSLFGHKKISIYLYIRYISFKSIVEMIYFIGSHFYIWNCPSIVFYSLFFSYQQSWRGRGGRG